MNKKFDNYREIIEKVKEIKQIQATKRPI